MRLTSIRIEERFSRQNPFKMFKVDFEFFTQEAGAEAAKTWYVMRELCSF